MVKKDISGFAHPSTSSPPPPDEANTVSESTEMLDAVSPSITTNFIGQKTDETGDMCERSCEELSTMFRELKGLRVVVSNLIDGLQKVVGGVWSVVVVLEVEGLGSEAGVRGRQLYFYGRSILMSVSKGSTSYFSEHKKIMIHGL